MPDKEFVLKPCPFCGDNEAPLVVVRRGKDGWRDRFLVLCDYEHGGCGGSSGWYHYEPEAVGAWNRRATAADVEPVKHGYWYFRGGRPCCSVCNTKALWKDEGGTGGFSHEYVGAKSKRCPECGAKMDKEVYDA